jgi:glutathione synthase/RimK-type ligase-like ATP-grasp enzyme
LFFLQNKYDVFKYIFTGESSQIMSFLNDYTSTKPLGDKKRFQYLCRKNNIAVPETYKVISRTDDSLEGLPKNKELFVKPVNGNQSRGISTIIYKNGTWYFNKKVVDKYELKSNILSERKYKEYLIQEKLTNHKLLQAYSETDTCTLRIVTGNKNNKNIEYFTAILFIPVPEKDYFVREKDYFVAPVNNKGVLGKAYYGTDIINKYSYHKFNNAKIEGVQLPFWNEAVDMSIKIHNQLKQFRFVAWDIVLTDNGPVMLEGNHSWGAASIQRAHNKSMYELGFWDFIKDKLEFDVSEKIRS